MQFYDLGKNILNILVWKLSHKWQNGLPWAPELWDHRLTYQPISPFHISIPGYIELIGIQFCECQQLSVYQHFTIQPGVPLNLLSPAKCGKCSINTAAAQRPTCRNQSGIFLLFYIDSSLTCLTLQWAFFPVSKARNVINSSSTDYQICNFSPLCLGTEVSVSRGRSCVVIGYWGRSTNIFTTICLLPSNLWPKKEIDKNTKYLIFSISKTFWQHLELMGSKRETQVTIKHRKNCKCCPMTGWHENLCWYCCSHVSELWWVFQCSQVSWIGRGCSLNVFVFVTFLLFLDHVSSSLWSNVSKVISL